MLPLDAPGCPTTFSLEALAAALEGCSREIVFAFVFGSSKDGVVRPGGDLDVAVFLKGKMTLELYLAMVDAVEKVVSGVKCDLGVLNSFEPIYGFEVLKGKLLFCCDEAEYASYYSLICRKYEFQMADYERQLKYRLEYYES